MNYEEFIQRAQDYKKLLPALFAAIMALLLIVFLLIGLSFHLSKRHEVVLVPMTLKSVATIGTSSVSPQYLTAFALSVVSLRMNFTPDTVKNQYSYLLHFISPEAYGQMNNEFIKEVANIVKRKISSSFSVNDIELKPHTLSVKITGILNRYVGSVKLPEKTEVFELMFSNNNGALTVTNFEESKKQ